MLFSDTAKRHENRPLLVLDIDETLLYAATSPLSYACDYKAQRTWIYKRPHVDTFLHFCAARFDIAVWTAARYSYAEEILQSVFPFISPALVFSEQDCIRISSIHGQYIAIKPLNRLQQLGYSLERVLVIDDTQENHCLNPNNLIPVHRYQAQTGCDELPMLQRYLQLIRDVARLDTLDHQSWREVVCQP